MASKTPSQDELDRRKTVGINKETVTNVSSTDFPYHYPGEDHSWSLQKFEDNLRIEFHYNEQFDSSFSLIGVDASIANAFRRILISEIPTLAIENVFINNNTSVIQDEVLAHRLGLIPFKGNNDGLRNFMKWRKKPESGDGQENVFDYNTVQLRLKLQCTRKESASPNETDPLNLYNHAHVYARDIEFMPVGRQVEYFSGAHGAIQPVHPDILIAKMRPEQEIDLLMYMHKGIGADHAKFSPVATASYRLMPTIDIIRPIIGADAQKFKKCFLDGVIGLEKITRADSKKDSEYIGHEGDVKAVVEDPMKDSVSRECLRHPEFEGKVKLGRRRDHFIFSIESSGQWDSDELFLESIKLLKEKCNKFEKQVVNMVR